MARYEGDSAAAIARRVEGSQARRVAQYPEAYARVFPDRPCGALVRPTGVAVFAGAGSPATQVVAFGIEDVSVADFDALESYLLDRGVSPRISVASTVPRAAFELLESRGYERHEAGDILVLDDLERGDRPKSDLKVRIVEPRDLEEWARAGAEGFTEDPAEIIDEIDLLKVFFQAPGMVPFLAEIDGVVAAASILVVDGDLAHFIATSTRPAYRRRGVQLALLEARLEHARNAGVKMAAVGAEPGGGSHRNVTRMGFEVAYQRERWRKRVEAKT